MKVLSLLFFVALFFHNSYSFKIPNIISLAVNRLDGTVKGIFYKHPATNIFRLAEFVDNMCSHLLSEKIIAPQTDSAIKKMKLELVTAGGVQYFPLLNSQEMANNKNFDREKKVVFIVQGWMALTHDTTVTNLTKALIYRGDTNVVVVDNSHLVRTLYTWSAFNTKKIGEELAKSLVNLIKVIPVKNIHLIGHSLGAQIVGAAGRYFQKQSGQNLSHITGLDPANPCFNRGETFPGIRRGNADFVDIYHTNPGVFGQLKQLGDVDYYPGGLHPIKPGCRYHRNLCSHERAWLYYTESVYPQNVNNFLGTRCTSLDQLRQRECKGDSYVMGYAVSHDLRGIFYSLVNDHKPYGKNAIN